jgi:hypothetical protein
MHELHPDRPAAANKTANTHTHRPPPLIPPIGASRVQLAKLDHPLNREEPLEAVRPASCKSVCV